MPAFSQRSADKLLTCEQDLQKVFFEVVKHFDCTVLEGIRNPETQKKYVAQGRSKTMHSKHLTFPSQAVDVVPYPINWQDTERMTLFIGFVLGVAKMMGINIRSGIDWDMDTETRDTSFKDYPHFEIVNN